MDRVLLIDKPSGMTSHDVVDRVRRASGIRRVGHAGTLDPSATGLLVILVGRATRLAQFFADEEKEYRGQMVLGVATDTQDAQGRVISRKAISGIAAADVERAFAGFVGAIDQVPPMVSAIKHDGVPLYELARKGVTVPREPRGVLVRRFELLGYREPVVEFEVVCSKGTYVRTLAHDVGVVLGCGAHLLKLSRRRAGSFRVEDALSLDDVGRAGRKLGDVGLSMFEACAGWPALLVDARELEAIATGATIEVDGTRLASEAGPVRITPDGERLAAVGRTDDREGAATGSVRRVRPVRVFVEPSELPYGGENKAGRQ